ncbi:hypothetical protein, partial [Paenibacillus odorifer]|uniref:hypothetical protein n=1 Tax=Paenibacillus odorifer TaxID=189426 RepID=UPI001C4C56BA
ELHCLFFKFFVIPLSMFSHVNTPPWTHYRQSVNYCPLFILASWSPKLRSNGDKWANSGC